MKAPKMLGGNPLSYCEWNKSGSRDDDAEIVCYYGWQKHWHQDRNCWGLIPEKRASAKRIKEIIWGV